MGRELSPDTYVLRFETWEVTIKIGAKSSNPGSVKIAKTMSFRARYVSLRSKKSMGRWACFVVINKS
jgi:hypothetical protein